MVVVLMVLLAVFVFAAGTAAEHVRRHMLRRQRWTYWT